jgi:hypothetical protein
MQVKKNLTVSQQTGKPGQKKKTGFVSQKHMAVAKKLSVNISKHSIYSVF